MASIGGSQLPNFGPGARPAKETDAPKRPTTPGSQAERTTRARAFKAQQVMAQLTGKVAEARKLKKMAMRKARRKRRRKKKRGGGK